MIPPLKEQITCTPFDFQRAALDRVRQRLSGVSPLIGTKFTYYHRRGEKLLFHCDGLQNKKVVLLVSKTILEHLRLRKGAVFYR